MNKKAILASTLVTVIVFAIIFVVVLRFYGAILAILKGLGEDYLGCLLKKVISAYTKVPLIGVETWGAFCLPVMKTITMSDEGENLIPIDIELTKKELKNVEKWYKGKGDFESERWYRKYRLDQAIAKEMKRCWGRNGQGELPLGPLWHDSFIKTIKERKIFYCDICAKIKFDEEVKNEFTGNLFLTNFLKRNPIRAGSSLSYWEFLKDDDFSTDLKDISYSTDKDLAIVYVRVNYETVGQTVKNVLRILPLYTKKDIPIPYDTVILRSFDETFNELGCRT